MCCHGLHSNKLDEVKALGNSRASCEWISVPHRRLTALPIVNIPQLEAQQELCL